MYIGQRKCLGSNPSKMRKIMKSKQNRRCTSSMYEQLLLQNLNKKELNVLELQVTQTRHKIGISDGKTSKFNPPQI